MHAHRKDTSELRPRGHQIRVIHVEQRRRRVRCQNPASIRGAARHFVTAHVTDSSFLSQDCASAIDWFAFHFYSSTEDAVNGVHQRHEHSARQHRRDVASLLGDGGVTYRAFACWEATRLECARQSNRAVGVGGADDGYAQ